MFSLFVPRVLQASHNLVGDWQGRGGIRYTYLLPYDVPFVRRAHPRFFVLHELDCMTFSVVIPQMSAPLFSRLHHFDEPTLPDLRVWQACEGETGAVVWDAAIVLAKFIERHSQRLGIKG